MARASGEGHHLLLLLGHHGEATCFRAHLGDQDVAEDLVEDRGKGKGSPGNREAWKVVRLDPSLGPRACEKVGTATVTGLRPCSGPPWG